jgi:hypothetical protein
VLVFLSAVFVFCSAFWFDLVSGFVYSEPKTICVQEFAR